MEGNGEIKSTSHKNEKVKSYSLGFKLAVVKYAKETSIGAVSRKFDVDRKRIREWKKNEVSINEKSKAKSKGKLSKRLDGGGKKLQVVGLEQNVLEWISDQRSKDLRVSRKQIMRKAKQYAEKKSEEEEQLIELRAEVG